MILCDITDPIVRARIIADSNRSQGTPKDPPPIPTDLSRLVEGDRKILRERLKERSTMTATGLYNALSIPTSNYNR